MDDAYVAELRSTWEQLGEADPLWGVLSDPAKAGGRWDPVEFFASGRAHVETVMEHVRKLGLARRRRAALDFGCGVGRLSQALSAYFERVVGVDISQAMINAATTFDRSGGRCEFVHNVRADLQFLGSESVDLVVSFIVLQHMRPDLARRYLVEFARVLAPGGTMVVQIPGYLRAGRQEAAALRAEIFVAETPAAMAASSSVALPVRVVNRGVERWESSADHPLRVGNHWLNASGAMAVLDDGRVKLKLPLDPGEGEDVVLTVTAPASPGDYQLVVDVVEEGIGWLASYGSPTARSRVRVTSDSGQPERPRPDDGQTGVTWQPPVAFEMNAIPPSAVISDLERHQLRIVEVRADESAGEAWHSFTYVAVKQPAPIVLGFS
jgi:SAM-dependent methyltransferase